MCPVVVSLITNYSHSFKAAVLKAASKRPASVGVCAKAMSESSGDVPLAQLVKKSDDGEVKQEPRAQPKEEPKTEAAEQNGAAPAAAAATKQADDDSSSDEDAPLIARRAAVKSGECACRFPASHAAPHDVHRIHAIASMWGAVISRKSFTLLPLFASLGCRRSQLLLSHLFRLPPPSAEPKSDKKPAPKDGGKKAAVKQVGSNGHAWHAAPLPHARTSRTVSGTTISPGPLALPSNIP